MTRIIGIDLSLAATGVAFPDGTFRTFRPKHEEIGGKLDELAYALSDCLVYYEADFCVVESIMSTGGFAAEARLALSRLNGVFLRELFRASVPYVEVHPMSLKKYATGSGAAQKQDMIREAKNRGAKVANDNEADAYFLKKIGDDYYNTSLPDWRELDKYQAELHERIKWPRLS